MTKGVQENIQENIQVDCRILLKEARLFSYFF